MLTFTGVSSEMKVSRIIALLESSVQIPSIWANFIRHVVADLLPQTPVSFRVSASTPP